MSSAERHRLARRSDDPMVPGGLAYGLTVTTTEHGGPLEVGRSRPSRRRAHAISATTFASSSTNPPQPCW
jgi:hypothetical protein